MSVSPNLFFLTIFFLSKGKPWKPIEIKKESQTELGTQMMTDFSSKNNEGPKRPVELGSLFLQPIFTTPSFLDSYYFCLLSWLLLLVSPWSFLSFSQFFSCIEGILQWLSTSLEYFFFLKLICKGSTWSDFCLPLWPHSPFPCYLSHIQTHTHTHTHKHTQCPNHPGPLSISWKH